MGCRYIFIDFPHLSPFLSFYPTQGYPTKAFNVHSYTFPMTWIEERFNKGTHSKCILIPLHAPFFYNLNLLFVINPQHQPLIEFIPTKDILFVIMQSLVQWKSTNTNYNKSNLRSLKTDDEKKKLACITSKFSFLSCLPPSYFPNLHSMS